MILSISRNKEFWRSIYLFKIHTRLNLSNRCTKETLDIYDDYQGIKEKNQGEGSRKYLTATTRNLSTLRRSVST